MSFLRCSILKNSKIVDYEFNSDTLSAKTGKVIIIQLFLVCSQIFLTYQLFRTYLSLHPDGEHGFPIFLSGGRPDKASHERFLVFHNSPIRQRQHYTQCESASKIHLCLTPDVMVLETKGYIDSGIYPFH